MNKILLIAVLVFGLFAISANAAPAEIIEGFVNQTTGTDTTLTTGLTFTVNNTGTTNLDINFTGYELANGNNKLYISSLSNITNLPNGSTSAQTFSVIIPKQARSGLYTGTLSATSNDTSSSTVEDQITINVNVTPSYSATMSPSSIYLGGASLNSTKTSAFNITNTGNEDLTSVSFDFSASGFNLQTNPNSFTLSFNTTQSVDFNVTIPASSSTGNVTLGSIKLVSTELNTTLSSVSANVGGGLEIEDLDVFLTTRDPNLDVFIETRSPKTASDTDVNDGEKLDFSEKVGPESELRFNLDIENTFADDEGIDINDITVKVTIVEIDDGDDIEEESGEFDLDPDTTEVVDVYVKIPLSVDEGVYDVVIEVVGEDDNGNEHTVEVNLELDIDKETRDVSIVELSLFPEKIKCSGTSTLTATIKNLGKRLEEKGKLDMANKELDIDVVVENIVLEEDPFDDDNEFTKGVPINVDKNTKAGTYPITVKSYVLGVGAWDTKTVNLVVESCSGQVEEEPEEEIEETETVEVTEEEPEEETVEGVKVPVLVPSTTTEVPLTKRPGFWFTLVLVNIVVVGGAIYLGIQFYGKKPQ